MLVMDQQLGHSDWRGKTPIAEAANASVTSDFMLVSGGNGTVYESEPLGSTGNWFVYSGV